MGRRRSSPEEYVHPATQSTRRQAEQAGGTVIEIQNAQRQGWDSGSGKPEKLQQLGVSDDAWQTFDAKVSATVAGMKSESAGRFRFRHAHDLARGPQLRQVFKEPAAGLPSPDGRRILLRRAVRRSLLVPIFILPPLCFAAYFGLLWWVLKRNREADVELPSAGQRLASETGLNVEYRSEGTKLASCSWSRWGSAPARSSRSSCRLCSR